MTSRRFVAAALAVAMLALAGSSLAHPLLRAEAHAETPFGEAHADATVPSPVPHEHDDKDDNTTRPPPSNKTFSIGVDPRMQEAPPGATVRFSVIVKAVEDRTVNLSVDYATRGYDVSLEPRLLHVKAGGWANATLTVRVPDEGWSEWARFGLNATAQDPRERHTAAAEVHTGEATVPPPPPPAAPRFTMAVRPIEQAAGPNETVVYAIHLKADGPLRVHLHALAPDGFDARIAPGVVDLRPNETYRTNLTVHTPHGDWSNATIRINATAEETGQHEIAWVRVYREEVTTQPPPENGTSLPSRAPPAPSPARPPMGAEATRTTSVATSDHGPRASTNTTMSITLGRTA